MRPKNVSFDQVITYTFYCRATIGRKWQRAPVIKVPEGRFQTAIKPWHSEPEDPRKAFGKAPAWSGQFFQFFKGLRKVAETGRACTSIMGDVWRSIRIEDGPRICKRGPASSLSPRLWRMCRIYLRWWHHIKLIRAAGKTVRKSQRKSASLRIFPRQVLSGWKNDANFHIFFVKLKLLTRKLTHNPLGIRNIFVLN